MLLQVPLGCALMFVTTMIHAGGMAAALRWLARVLGRGLGEGSFWTRSLVVSGVVLILFVALLVEAAVWAMAYVALGAIREFEEALYFSTVTYTTLGYGDVVLDERWRLLASFEAANGIIIFGWTTALIFVAVRRISRQLPRLQERDGD